MTIDWEKRQSEVISAMRFPLIMIVVIAHVLPFTQTHVGLDLSSIGIYHFISELVSHNIAKICVPCFFIFSGYFFFLKMEKLDFAFYKKQINRRGESLFIPYLIWNTIDIIAYIALYYIFLILSLQNDSGYILDNSLYQLYWGMPVDYPLWFMRDLVCMAVLSPLFYWLFKYTKIYGLLILMALYIGCVETNVPGLSTTAFFFFGSGAFFGINKGNILEWCHKIRKPAYIIATVLLVAATILNDAPYHEYIARVFAPFGIISAFNLADLWTDTCPKAKSLLLKLSSTTFFIYATHEIFIIGWMKGFFSRLPLAESGWGLLLSYFLIPTITVCICLAGYYLLNWLIPGFMRVATGGRAKPKQETAK